MCTNSMGSSMVRMWSCRSVLILSIMAASVVDLPDPVGPVTSTRPRGLSHILLTTAGRPNWLKDLISKGIRRKTAEVAPRWLKTLARKRARPFNPNEKSSSRLSSKRCFCESVITLYASCLVSAGVICGRSSGTRWPCTRICGGEFVVRCKSLPFISNMRFNKSLSDNPMMFLPQTLMNSFAGNFFKRGHARRHFDQTAAAQRDHALFDCLLLQFQRGRSNQHQFSNLIVHFHDFIQSATALVARVVADSTTFAFLDLDCLGFFRRKAFIN